MKHLILTLILFCGALSVSHAVEVTRSGPNTSKEEAERIKEDYLQVRQHAIKEYLQNGEIGPHSYRSISMQISFAEARGYRIEPPLRVVDKGSLGAALLMQVMEEAPRKFHYAAIYKIRP